jgi:hypothetical protein
MADFRRVVTAFALLVFLVGMANAQQILTCSSGVAVPPQLRGEGLTELVGDIVLDCSLSGIGALPPAGLANITVYAPVPITSRVDDGTAGISEALLITNEAPAGTHELAPDDATPGCTGIAPAACTYNAFQGYVAAPGAAPSVTFLGIPVVPPATPGQHRFYRITNVRMNVTSLVVANAAVPLQVQVAISGSTSITVPSGLATSVVGYVLDSMVFDGVLDDDADELDEGFSFRQCEDLEPPPTPMGYLRFRELFASAFKPQGDDAQNIPGFIYNTESGLTPSDSGGPIGIGAVADWGTRLRVRFSNIPLGTNVYVSCGNLVAPDNYPGTFSAAAGSAILHDGDADEEFDARCSAGSYALIVDADDDETSGTAIWEVLTASGATIPETFDFGIYFVAEANPQDTPAAGVQGRVAGNYAPTPASDEVEDWSVAMEDIIPRFIDPPVSDDLILFTLCQTNLLFPYVLGGVAGFDTGLAITNTSTDPWDTTPQSGTCDLNFYGENAPEVFTTPSIGLADTDQGAIWASTAMGLAQGFNGYIIAQCDFQYAHGFAFVSDIGAHDVAMGYLALILPDVERIGFRPVNAAASLTAESLNN